MQILQHQHERIVLRGTADELAEAVPHISTRQLRRELDRRRDVRERTPQGRRDTSNLRRHIAERLSEGEGAARTADHLLDDLDIGQVRRCAIHIDAVPGEHPHPVGLSLIADFGHQPGLSDAWLPSD